MNALRCDGTLRSLLSFYALLLAALVGALAVL
jgi:hypothetical protein